MSELEIYHCDEWHNPHTEFYLKHEADREIVHQKRKRCLALADYAEAESCYHTTLANGFWLLRNDITKRDKERIIAERWDKWQNRWLALADKYTEKEIKQ